MNGKCSSCGETVTRLLGEVVRVDLGEPMESVIVYRCPNCDVILGCQADPKANLRETARIVDDAFRKRGML